jgi:glycine/D-amino acid oxidase-like deaminating enzyme/nitrite reductase/ring-hydroxylating ferredoxin subunit
MTTTPLSGKPTSYWVDSTPDTTHPQLDRDLSVDVAIVGGGMLGITAALMLKRQGATVAVLEGGRVAGGVTAYTTAKVASSHGVHYMPVTKSFGADGARAYADAQQSALAQMGAWVDELGIDCDWRRKPSFIYSVDAKERGRIEGELEACQQAGLPVSLVTDAPELPFPIVAAVRYDDQAEFHPRKYLLALAREIPGDGSAIFERSRVVSAGDGDTGRVTTAEGYTVTANDVIVATHFPFMDRGLYFARQHPERSYALGVYVDDHQVEGMYLSTESPSHTMRSIPTEQGEMLLVGGESHKVGQADEEERYAKLEGWAREHWNVREVAYRWSTQDAMPVDGVPFVGKLNLGAKSFWVGTGFRKWGLTNGHAAAAILTAAIDGRELPYAHVFDSTRVGPLAGAKELIKENVNVGRRFFQDHLARPDERSPGDLAPGEGGTVRDGTRKIGAYRDDEGRLHTVSTMCTHMGCAVAWNAAETSWDCPCHGSRFHYDGTVLEGPAVKDLKPVSLDDGGD